MKKQQGFTLIELMIVVAIIGVLSAIAIPAYKNYVTKSEVASAIGTLKALITPLETQIQEKGTLTTSTISLADIGTISGANPLGIISVPKVTSAASSLTLKFSSSSSIINDHVQYFKNSDTNNVWSCQHDTPVDIKGCNKITTITP